MTRDERLTVLGHAIWRHVLNIEAYHHASRCGTGIVRAEMPPLIKEEEQALWGDLQTLFRGGVFPEDMGDEETN